MTLRKRLRALEKALNPRPEVEILTFNEEDVARWLGVCKKFNDRWPGAVVFSHTESEDVQAQGGAWGGNVAGVVAFAEIQAGMGNSTIMEFIENELPGICEEPRAIH